MVDRGQAQEIASITAGSLLLEEYEVQVADEPDRWIIAFVPRARVRGGGFQMSTKGTSGKNLATLVRNQAPALSGFG